MVQQYDLVLRGVVGVNWPQGVEIGIRHGKIEAVQEHIKGQGKEEVDGEGSLVVPGFVDLHSHLDQAFMGGADRWSYLTIGEMAKSADQVIQREWDVEKLFIGGIKVAVKALEFGTTALRTHATLSETTGLRGIHALQRVQETMIPYLDLQIVAFHIGGFSSSADGGEALLRSALDAGANLVGGKPRWDADPRPYLDMLFRVAQAYDVNVDVHVDESNDPDDLRVEQVAEATIAHKWQGRVTAGHVSSLYWVDDQVAQRIIAKIAEADISVVTNPITNLYVRGVNNKLPTGVTRVRELLDAGVRVGVGTDDVQDMFCPLGTPNMLLAGLLLAYQRRLGDRPVPETILDLITQKGAEIFGIQPGYGIAVGQCADLVVLDACTLEEVFVDLPMRRAVIKQGKLVVRNNRIIQVVKEKLEPFLGS